MSGSNEHLTEKKNTVGIIPCQRPNLIRKGGKSRGEGNWSAGKTLLRKINCLVAFFTRVV